MPDVLLVLTLYEHSFFLFLTYGGTEIQGHKLLVQDHTARNGPSRDSKLSLSPKTVLFFTLPEKVNKFQFMCPI